MKYLTTSFVILWLCPNILHSQDSLTVPPDDLNGIDMDLWESVILLSNDENCTLPCWWGFELESTTIDEVMGFLETTQFIRSQSRSVYPDLDPYEFLQSESYNLTFFEYSDDRRRIIGRMSYNFTFLNDIHLSGMSISLWNPQKWLTDEQNPFDLSKVLAYLENEPQVYTSISPTLYENELPLWLLYPEQNLLLHYNAYYTYPLICIDVEHVDWIDVDISTFWSVEDFESAEILVPINEGWRLENITQEDFIDFFRHHPNECLDITDYPQSTEENPLVNSSR